MTGGKGTARCAAELISGSLAGFDLQKAQAAWRAVKVFASRSAKPTENPKGIVSVQSHANSDLSQGDKSEFKVLGYRF